MTRASCVTPAVLGITVIAKDYEISLLPILCMLIARMEMRTSRVSGDSDIIT